MVAYTMVFVRPVMGNWLRKTPGPTSLVEVTPAGLTRHTADTVTQETIPCGGPIELFLIPASATQVV